MNIMRLLLLLLASALLVVISACSKSSVSPANEEEAAFARNKAGANAVTLMPLDDEGNPFREMYREWDYWLVANARPAPQAYKAGEYPDDLTCLATRVTPTGYVVPLLEEIRLREEAVSEGLLSEYFNEGYYLYGEGTADKEMVDQYFNEAHVVRASFVPLIPDWLAESPPIGAMLMPNGEVITWGVLGSANAPDAKPCCGGSGYPWCRYSADGELLRSSNLTWWDCYFNETKLERPTGEFFNREDGYIIFYSEENPGQILSIWDYDGTQLESNIPPPHRDPHPFRTLNRAFLVTFYEAQNGLL